MTARVMGPHTSPAENADFRSSLLQFARSGSLSSCQLLTACLDSSIIGIAIVDKRFRLEAFNRALAAMLNISAERHLGKTIQETLGRGANQLERELRKVFSLGHSVSNIYITEATPRATPVRWTGCAFPIRNDSGVVIKAGVILLQGKGFRVEENGARPREVPRDIKEDLPASIFAFERAKLRSPLFRDLDDSSLDLVLSVAQVAHRSRGDLFCQQGSTATHLYLFTKGRLKLSGVTRAGKEVLIDWMKPGDIVGLGTLVPLPVEYCWTACAVEDSTALAWDQATIRGLASCFPSIYENALQTALKWVLQLQERLEEMATEMVEQRLAHTILRMAPHGSNKDVAQLRISDEELALMTGTTLFAVSRIIRRWQKLGYVQKARKRLLVLNRRGLMQIAEHGGQEQVESIESVSLETGS